MPKSNGVIKILGIDPGLADLGFGVINKTGNKLTMIDYGCVKTKAGQNLEKRLVEINNSLEQLIKIHRPGIISIEELFFCKNLKTAIAVGEARGVVLLVAGKHQIEIAEFTPMQIKLALTSYGKASKTQVKQMVKNVLNLKELPKSDDAADALAAAICCANSLKK